MACLCRLLNSVRVFTLPAKLVNREHGFPELLGFPPHGSVI